MYFLYILLYFLFIFHPGRTRPPDDWTKMSCCFFFPKYWLSIIVLFWYLISICLYFTIYRWKKGLMKVKLQFNLSCIKISGKVFLLINCVSAIYVFKVLHSIAEGLIIRQKRCDNIWRGDLMFSSGLVDVF